MVKSEQEAPAPTTRAATTASISVEVRAPCMLRTWRASLASVGLAVWPTYPCFTLGVLH